MNSDVIKHVKGESLFVDDFAVQEGTLYIAVFDSPVARGKIVNVDYSEAEKYPGLKAIITASDIPGENQIGNIIQDETLLAENEVEYIGEPIALIIADSADAARKAR